MDEPRFLLVDGHGLAYRAFYALPELTAPDGTPVNAVLGFLNMLQKVLEERRPEGWGLFFDPKGPTARKEMYDAYKEGRRPTPEAFKVQLPLLLELLEALGHRVTLRPGVEADDGIAATASALAAEDSRLLVLTRTQFERMCAENKALALKMALNMARLISFRLRHTSSKLLRFL